MASRREKRRKKKAERTDKVKLKERKRAGKKNRCKCEIKRQYGGEDDKLYRFREMKNTKMDRNRRKYEPNDNRQHHRLLQHHR